MRIITKVAIICSILLVFFAGVVVGRGDREQAFQEGKQAAQRQIRLQLERGHQQDYGFEISCWPDMTFYPRGDRDGVNYKFERR